MVRLISHEPVRTPNARPQLLEVGEKCGKEARPILQGQSQEVYHDMLLGRVEEPESFCYRGSALLIPEPDVVFVTYDDRQAIAAEAAGLTVLTPV